jgi:hypothetical protein
MVRFGTEGLGLTIFSLVIPVDALKEEEVLEATVSTTAEAVKATLLNYLRICLKEAKKHG